MCGIAGFASFKENSRTTEKNIKAIEAMTSCLVHRGPDAQGIFMEQNVCFGHRRLAVVDIEGGRQPMSRSIDGHTCTIVYNGELYNTAEVRSELTAIGYVHTTNSDTETVLLAYMAWGEASCEKLNGIFAYAIFDANAQQIFLVRDRFGVKPLFYSIQDNTLLFASELKSILASGMVVPRVGREGLAEVFGLFPSRTPANGVYENVFELLPACYAIFNENELHEQKYWQLIAKKHTDSLSDTIEKVRWLVTDAITRQLVSDVPLCTFLSGGLDSSAISAIAALNFKEKNQQLHTYSIDYEGNDKFFHKSIFQPDADAPYVELMSKKFDTFHHYYISDSKKALCDALIEATIARDLPGMADVDASLLLFCREVKKDFTVALSGECADEIFGGYPWFHDQKAFDRANFPWIHENNDRVRLLTKEMADYIKPLEYVNRRYLESISRTPYLKGENAQECRRREIQMLNLDWFMANLLERKDRMSMASGLEVRVPFCDHRIVEYAYNIPWEQKALDGREKGLLREALKGLLPEEILFRKKSPYPKTHNPEYEQEVKKALLERINDPSCPLRQLINIDELILLINEPSDYGKPWFGQLMARPQLFAFLIQIDVWLRENKVQIF